MKTLFLTIRDRLKTIDDIKWVDKDYNQLDDYKESPPVAFPCALVKITMACETLCAGTQICTGTVTIRNATNMMIVESASGASPAAQEAAFKHDDIAGEIFQLMQGYTDSQVKNFDRINYVEEQRKDKYMVSKQVFSCTFIEKAY
ncbi:MAG: hypothetical protein ACXVAY_01475 [Mucilaginibacter sp.]